MPWMKLTPMGKRNSASISLSIRDRRVTARNHDRICFQSVICTSFVSECDDGVDTCCSAGRQIAGKQCDG